MLEPITDAVRVNYGAGTWTWNALSVGLAHNTRQHVMFTYNDGVGTLYSNGVQVAQRSDITLDLHDTNTTWIGRRGGHLQHFFDGRIDDVRVYDKPLSATEVSSLYYAGSDYYQPAGLITNVEEHVATLLDEGLIAYWDFDDANADDKIGTNNGAEVNDAAYIDGKI